MSLVTNYILLIENEYYVGWSRDAQQLLFWINDALKEEGQSFGDKFLGKHYDSYGGSKVLEVDIAVMAANYIRPGMMEETVRGVMKEKEWKGMVQLLSCDQEENYFRELIREGEELQ